MALFSKKPKTPQDTKPKKYTPKELETMKWKRVKVPTVFQMEAVECGAAALAMVMAYHGKFVSLAELRTECGVSRDGSKASNMVKAARRYGFVAKGYKKEEINQLKPLHFPMIVFWNFNHFIVLEGVKGNKFCVNDPSTGPRTMEFEDFDMGFSGVVLDFEKGPDFEKSGCKPSIIPGLVRRLSHSKLALSYVLFLNLFMIIPGLILPACTRIFIDSYLIKRMDSWVQPLLLAMLLVTVIQTILAWMQAHYYLKFETKLAVVHSTKFFWHIFRLPVEFFNQRFAGDVAARVSINDTVADLLAGQLAGNFVSFLLVFFYGIIMWNYDWVLTLLCFISSGFQIGYMKYVSKQMVDKNLRMEQEGGKLAGISMGGLVCIETLKASGAESDFFAKWSGYFTKMANSGHEMSLFTTRLGILPKVVNNFLSMAILGVGGMRVMDGHLTMGMLVAFQTLMGSFTGPVMGLVGLGTQIQQLSGSMSRLDDVLNNEIDPIYTTGPDADNIIKSDELANVEESQTKNVKTSTNDLPAPIDINDYMSIEKHKNSIFSNVRICKLTGKIELKNVTFGYSRMAPPLIKDFNLTIKPGQRVAFVGPSGCGKSTISKLICGLYQPWSGQILFDGKERKDLSRKVMTNSLAMVNQEILLFEGTIKDNLTLWDSTMDQKRILQAAKDAVIHDDISMRPGSYDSVVVEGGFNFSGGQRQRVEIARALVTSPTILVLDEATSALDPYTEELIDINLRRRGCTCVIVAHRLSTIRDADEIIVMNNGVAIQRGTHDEMKEIDGAYARLISHE